MRKSVGVEAIQEVASRNGVSAAEVRREIELAIDTGMANPDPKIRAYWAKIPRSGERPTPEEVIVYLAGKIYRHEQFKN